MNLVAVLVEELVVVGVWVAKVDSVVVVELEQVVGLVLLVE
jgi:hypothetical protein